MKKLCILVLASTILTACASGVDAVERLGRCVIKGNVNDNCTFSTLEGDPEIKTEATIRANQ